MKNLSLNLIGGKLTRSELRNITGGNVLTHVGEGGGCTERKCNWNRQCFDADCGMCKPTSDPKVAGYCS